MKNINTVDIAYNSQLEELIIPEYGRYVQDLISHCKTIEDDAYRQAFAAEIVNLMQIMTPYNKNIEENKKKLWHHFFRIAKYDINVTPPAGVEITPDSEKIHPEKISYPVSNERYRHYGNYVNELIKKAIELEAGPKRDAFAQIIGSYMKLAYKNWNKEHYVSDDLIKIDLEHLSNGILKINEEIQFNALNENSHKNQRRIFKSSQRQNNNFKFKGKNKRKNR